MLRTDLLIEKRSQVCSIIRPNPQDTLSKLQDHTIPTPQIPDPATTQAHVNSPTVQNGCASDFCTGDVIVQNCASKQWYSPIICGSSLLCLNCPISLPQTLNAIGIKLVILTHDGHFFNLCLGNQHAVERVF